jgi:mono/diheme cytochrome c family protein
LSAWIVAALISAVATTACATAQRRESDVQLSSFGFGQPATDEQIRAWDTDVRPDGQGLPAGRGTVAQGASIYAAKCAACHGERGRDGPFDTLVGRVPRDAFAFGRDPSLKRTIGSYWPYATTLFDYTRRAMPWMSPGSLDDDEVYALVAYLLFLNEIVPEDAVMDADSLPRVVMPARDRFVRDNRRGGSEIR